MKLTTLKKLQFYLKQKYKKYKKQLKACILHTVPSYSEQRDIDR